MALKLMDLNIFPIKLRGSAVSIVSASLENVCIVQEFCMFAIFSLFQTSALKCKDFKYCFPFSYTTHTIYFSVSYKQIYNILQHGCWKTENVLKYQSMQWRLNLQSYCEMQYYIKRINVRQTDSVWNDGQAIVQRRCVLQCMQVPK